MLESSRLLKIKTILRIVISVLVIFSMLKSCARAFTWEEFVEFEGYANVNQTNIEVKTAVNWFLNNQTAVNNQLSQLSVNKNNYNYFLITNNSSSLVKCEIWFITFSNQSNSYYEINANNGIYWNNYGTAVKCFIWDSGYNPTKENVTLNNRYTGVMTGLLPTEPRDGNYRGYVLNNYYIQPGPAFEFEQKGSKVTYQNNSEVYAIKQRYLTLPFIIGKFPEIGQDYYNYIFKIYNNNELVTNEYNYRTTYNLHSNKNMANDSKLSVTGRTYLQFGDVRRYI